MIRTVLIVVTALVLVACNATESRSADTAATRAAQSDSRTPPPRPGNGRDLPARPVSAAMPDFTGIGPLRFGMTAEQMRKAWGAPLYEAPAHDSQACYYLRPRKDDYDLLFMVEGDRFVRVDVKTGTKLAPGGGRVGMSIAELRKLYDGRTKETPGKYEDDARIVEVAAPHGENGRLVFVTDASRVVKSWRIGVVPQVDYVEGCG